MSGPELRLHGRGAEEAVPRASDAHDPNRFQGILWMPRRGQGMAKVKGAKDVGT